MGRFNTLGDIARALAGGVSAFKGRLPA